jgi:diaminopimelate epimerase
MLPAEKLDCEMRIFNADGSEAEMCGNGLRGVVRLLDQSGEKDRIYRILTKAGVRQGQVQERRADGSVQIVCDMGRPSFMPNRIPVLFDDVMVMDEEFELGDKTFKISCVSMGNPHCVIEVSDLDNFPVAEVGPQIERHEVFPQGTNVEFIEIREAQVFQRTWERGSGETQACGTGACAVGVILIMKKRFQKEVVVHLRGGDLKIQWDGLREVFMTGDSASQGRFSVDV